MLEMEPDVSLELSGELTAEIDIPASSIFPNFLLKLPTEIPNPKAWIQRQQVRPWLTFIKTSNFSVAPSISRLGRRFVRNIEYFQANYLFVFLGLIVYCLVTSPLILLALAGTFYIGYKLNERNLQKKLVLLGKEVSLAQQYGLLALCSLPIYYLVGAHAAIFWVLGASIVTVTLHGVFYNIETLIPKPNDEFGLLEAV